MHRTLNHPAGPRQIHLGGWKKQQNDPRDEGYRVKLHAGLLGVTRPPTCDQRSICSPVEDQLDLGSCTAHMFAGLVEANEHKAASSASLALAATVAKVTPPTPPPTPVPPSPPAPVPTKLVRASRLFEYYATRKIENTVGEDSGATIRDAIKAGVLYGVADEASWPYDTTKFTALPPTTVWSAAATHKVTSYHSISDGDLESMKTAIFSGFLVGFGFTVYDYMLSAEMASKGILPRPGPKEQVQGGHAVCLVGYDDTKVMPDGSKGAFLVRNSWGVGWAFSGYFWMSYDYVADTTLCSDFWVVQSRPL